MTNANRATIKTNRNSYQNDGDYDDDDDDGDYDDDGDDDDDNDDDLDDDDDNDVIIDDNARDASRKVEIFVAWNRLACRKYTMLVDSKYPSLIYINETFSTQLRDSIHRDCTVWPVDFECYTFPRFNASKFMQRNANGSYVFTARLVSNASPFPSGIDRYDGINNVAYRCDFPLISLTDKMPPPYVCRESAIDATVRCTRAAEKPVLIDTVRYKEGMKCRRRVVEKICHANLCVQKFAKKSTALYLTISPWIRFLVTDGKLEKLFVYYDIVNEKRAHEWWSEMTNLSDTKRLSDDRCNSNSIRSSSSLSSRLTTYDTRETLCDRCDISCLCVFSRQHSSTKMYVDCSRTTWPPSTHSDFIMLMSTINSRWNYIVKIKTHIHGQHKHSSSSSSSPSSSSRKAIDDNQDGCRMVSIEQIHIGNRTMPNKRPAILVAGCLPIEMKNFTIAHELDHVANACFNYCAASGCV